MSLGYLLPARWTQSRNFPTTTAEQEKCSSWLAAKVRQRNMEKQFGSERNRHKATAQNIAQHHDEFMLPKLN
jgi:hypothetical protein